ncbi:MAG: hypothetical protein WCB58_17460 [Acidobacteriaceae bacterium]
MIVLAILTSLFNKQTMWNFNPRLGYWLRHRDPLAAKASKTIDKR